MKSTDYLEIDSVQLSISDSEVQSAIVINLEKKISELSATLDEQKRAFDKLTHLAPRPADVKEQQASIAENIVELREQIILEKAALYNLIKQQYQ